MKKFIIGLMAFALVFSFGFTATAEETEGELDEILALLCPMFEDAGLDYPGCEGEEAGEETTTEETTQVDTRIPEGFSFDQNLKQGMSGENVMYLQILLNADVDTRLAESGAGSPGNETLYFGPITTAAVNKFQTKYASEVLNPIGLTMPTGFVGAQTRVKLNAVLGSGGVGTTPTGDSAILAQLQAIMTAIAALEARIDDMDTSVGEEGSVTVAVRNDIRDVDVYSGGTEDVAKFRFEATDSDVDVQRVDLYFATTTAAQLRAAISKVALYLDGEMIGEIDVNSTTVSNTTTYLRFSGLNINVPKGGYKDVVVTVIGKDNGIPKDNIELGPTDSDAVRGVDGAGVTITTGDAAIKRAFDYKGTSTATLSAKRHTDSPEKGVEGITKNVAKEVDLLVFDLEAEDLDVSLDGLTVQIEGAVSTYLSEYFNATVATEATFALAADKVKTFIEGQIIEVLLYDGEELLDTKTLTGGDVTNTGLQYFKYTGNAVFAFDPVVEVNKDAAKKLRVAVNLKVTEVEKQGFVLGANVLKESNNTIGYDSADGSVELGGSNVAGRGRSIYIALPVFSNITTSFVRNEIGTTSDAASGWIKFDVTASGGDIHFDRATGKDVTNTVGTLTDAFVYVTSGGFSLASPGYLTLTSTADQETTAGTDDYDPSYVVVDEAIKNVEVEFGTTTASKGNDNVDVTYLNWRVKGSGDKWYQFTWFSDFVEDLKTDSVTLYSTS
jgi:peptidoglycan hydrolase-like protein with peptidoglycan-binding domain